MEMIINKEKCLPIVGFERYHVSETGRVYRTDLEKKRSWRTKGKIYINEPKVRFEVRNNKMRQAHVSLTDTKGKLHNVALAPLIALTFGITEKKVDLKKQDFHYIDGDITNLHYTNLQVVERVQINAKLTPLDVKHIKKLIKKEIPLNRIAQLYGVSDMQINRIKTGENWGNGKRKIKAPKAPFEVQDAKMRRYIAMFDAQKMEKNIQKVFSIKRNKDVPTDNTIVGIVKGYKLSLKHSNITRAKVMVDKLNSYFFPYRIKQENL